MVKRKKVDVLVCRYRLIHDSVCARVDNLSLYWSIESPLSMGKLKVVIGTSCRVFTHDIYFSYAIFMSMLIILLLYSTLSCNTCYIGKYKFHT